MNKGSDGLHFNGVSSVEAVVENTWGINDLPTGVVVVEVTQVKILSGESVWLNVNISLSHIVHQTRFTNIWETCEDECSLIGINTWKSTQMLSHFFEITQG